MRTAKDKTGFGKALETARKRCNLRLVDLADKLDISVPFLSDVENGRRTLASARIIKVAEILGEDRLRLLILAARDRGQVIIETERLNEDQLRSLVEMSV